MTETSNKAGSSRNQLLKLRTPEETDVTATSSKAGRGRNQLLEFRTLGLLGAILILAVFFQSQRSTFFSGENLLTLTRTMSSLALIAFALMFAIILGELDLSVGSVYLLTSITLSVLWLGGGVFSWTVPFWLAALVAIAVSLVAGLLNGLLTTLVRIPSFIATLGMLSIAQGLALLISGAKNFNAEYNIPAPGKNELSVFNALGGDIAGRIPAQIVWLIAAFAIFWTLRHRTIFGFRCLAIGGNPEAARIARLPVRGYKIVAFMLCSGMAGLAGVLDFSYVGSVGPTSGAGLTFPVFAAVVIGGVSLTGGRGTVVGTLLGAVLLAVLNNGLALLGVGSFIQLIFVGAVTIGAVALDRISLDFAKRRSAASAAKAAA